MDHKFPVDNRLLHETQKDHFQIDGRTEVVPFKKAKTEISERVRRRTF